MNLTSVQDAQLLKGILTSTTGEASLIGIVLVVCLALAKALRHFSGRSQCCTTTNTSTPSAEGKGEFEVESGSEVKHERLPHNLTTSVRNWLFDLQKYKEAERVGNEEAIGLDEPTTPPVLRRSTRVYSS